MPDRNSNGRQWSAEEIAREVAKHWNDWRGVGVVAVILAESGGYEWIRPMVLKADTNHPSHLSTDRGICQFNSYWWADQCSDRVAFSGRLAINLMCETIADGDKWSLNKERLDWWNAHKSQHHLNYMGVARRGMNAVRKEQDLEAL